MISKNAEWIWINDNPRKNEYAFFEGEFDFNGQKAVFSVCAETDYILYINGECAAFSQFAGYPFEKYFDEIDITDLCKKGQNKFYLTVRYEGVNSQTHIDDGAGVIYSLSVDGSENLSSSADTLCGYDNHYVQHSKKEITFQLGLSSAMQVGKENEYAKAVVLSKTRNILPRPVKKTLLLPKVSASEIKENIYDLGRETAGYLFVKIKAETDCEVTVAYGQHLEDGCVRRRIGGRDFSLDFLASNGTHEFKQFFVRVSCRYLEVYLPKGAEILEIGLIPVLYPVTERGLILENPLDQKIYDTCVRTLRLCMNSHYEDTPWREQALYVLDSLNQMLCGYYTFVETEFQRANLVLMSKGKREDGFLELTFPSVNTPSIPLFSVMYPVAVYNYVMHTGDKSILSETMDTMLTIMNNFKSKIDEKGLILDFPAPFWNFFEWTDGSHDAIPINPNYVPTHNYHLILNCAFVYAGEKFRELCRMADVDFSCDFDGVMAAINREFFDEKSGNFYLRTDNREYRSQLGNAFALLIGLGDARTADNLKNDKTLIESSLSMLIYKYEALRVRGDNKDYILNDIREKYGYMLSCGATSFWETIKGDRDFGGAGSLCHGWSALPAYYYHKFNSNN